MPCYVLVLLVKCGLGGLLNAAFVGLMVNRELVEVALLLLGAIELAGARFEFGDVGVTAVGGEVEALLGANGAPAVGA